MTMAESAVEDAAAAPPGPAKPPPPSCTNNNTLAATANRNHRNPRKRKRLAQVLDILQAHRSSPSEGEVPRFPHEGSGPASEEEEDVFGSPRSTSGSGVDCPTGNLLSSRLKSEETASHVEGEREEPSIDQQNHHPHYPHHHPHHQHRHHRNHHRNSANHVFDRHPHHQHQHQHQHRQSATTAAAAAAAAAIAAVASSSASATPLKFPGCGCVHCSQSSTTSVTLPSPTSPHTPLMPLTPLTPGSLSPYSFEHYMHTKYLPDIFRGRSHSDSDVVPPPGWEQRVPSAFAYPPRSGSLESDTTSPQESPLDLSMKNLMTSAAGRPPALQLLPPGIVTRGSVSVPVVRGDVASPTTKESVAVRYNLEVSPVVEEMPPGADVAYVCPVCGQMFSLHDRLAKHMASRHRRQGPQDASAKAYLCDVCKRSFARSDMLTRHMRLHTGVKPYTCRVCNQVFSRSDHLSTHQRTHTGEKPYKCPQCAYAACRRDMITRHMRTHARFPDIQTPKTEPGLLTGEDSPTFGQDVVSPSPSPSTAIKAE